MFIEAAAQSSSAFNSDQQSKMGFLTMAKNIKLLEKLNEKIYIFRLKKETAINQYKQFSFETYSQGKSLKVVSGSFTLVIEE